jgi:DNA-binding transcriptional LysR family regulator
MDQLSAIRSFVRVAESGSFSAVARELGLTQSQVSRQVAHLEAELRLVLLTRSTRRVQLTPEGRLYLAHARRALAELEQGRSAAQGARGELAGQLRLAVSSGFLRFVLLDPLTMLLREHREFGVELLLGDRFIDLVGEGADLALRVGALDDSGLVARRLMSLSHIVVASPAYLRESSAHAPPILGPQALVHHQCLVFTGLRERRWVFHGPGGSESVPVGGRVAFDLGEVALDLVLRDLGVAMLPRLAVTEHLAQGRLVQLLPQWKLEPLPVHAVYPASRRQVARVELVIERLLHHFGGREL